MAEQARWWEQYYVRYFVGTAFAIPLLMMIGQREPWKQAFFTTPPAAWLSAGAVAVGGLAFCYIASAPILVLHAMRARIPRTSATYAWIIGVVSVISVGGLVALCSSDSELKISTESVLLLVPYTCVVFSQLLLLVWGVRRKRSQPAASVSQASSATAPGIDEVKDFYVLVSSRRAEAIKPAGVRSPRSEYIESYRHLREHGNAMLIVVAEAILALALFYAPGFGAAILIIIVWVLPATIVWLFATWLEASLASAPVN